MANAMDDARYEAGTYRRVELITGKRRRRSWTDQDKARIVAESAEAGANISEVVRVVMALPAECYQSGDVKPER